MTTNTNQQVAQSKTLEEIAERVTKEWYQTAGATAITLADAILSVLRNERERCAKVADNHEGTHGNMHFGGCGAAIAATIRSQP